MQPLLAILSGSIVGLSLGLIGGGGSILAVPLLLYVVGVGDPHVAIGTSALAVAVNAFANLVPHARAGHVRWRSALPFALIGVVGTIAGSSLGKSIAGEKLLALFAVLMLAIAVLMQRHRSAPRPAEERGAAARLGSTGFGVGALSGFFGIGGGFLVVPGLVFATGMPMIEAIGSSLVAVGAFGAATAANYAISNLVAWTVALEYILGGIVGGWVGARLAVRCARERMLLNRIFGGILAAVAIYILMRSFAVGG